jgi:GTP-binding protein HflX
MPRDKTISKETVLDELKGLVKTAGAEVVGTLVQHREHPHPGTCLGPGKLEELKQLIALKDAELVVFDNHLTPAQGRRLEEETQTVIVDRSEVILDIFATAARTHEAKLQVELAQLLYFRPRLKRMWTHLERIQGGIGTGRGPGEKQLETDRRLLDRRVAELKRKLAEIESRRERTVANRHDDMTVSLVGYTNAGKSTLMNSLTDAGVYVADKLFATLDTRTRKWAIPHCGNVLISDTVGFVRNLPHQLVASFRSTLEEARRADLLLHVVDASHPEAKSQIETVYQVLEEIGVDCNNVLLVLNKADAITDRSLIDVLRRKYENSISLSAKTGEGLDRLTDAVANRLSGGFVDAEISTGLGNGRLFAFLAEHGEILRREYEDSRVTLTCRLPKSLAARLSDEETTVTFPGSHLAATAEYNGKKEW